jgi:hypothetical protein
LRHSCGTNQSQAPVTDADTLSYIQDSI